MYNNPIGPGAAGAGLGGMLLTSPGFGWWLVFGALAAFALVNALSATVFRVLPAGLTERPRAWCLRLLGHQPGGRTSVKRYDFGDRRP